MNNKFYQELHKAIQLAGQAQRTLQNMFSDVTPKIDNHEDRITEVEDMYAELLYEDLFSIDEEESEEQ